MSDGVRKLGDPTPCQCGHVALWHAVELRSANWGQSHFLYYGQCEVHGCDCQAFEAIEVAEEREER